MQVEIFVFFSVDLTKNISDIFLVCDEGSGKQSFQIWVNNKDSGFTLAQHEPLPSGVQAISFADVGQYTKSLYLPSTDLSRRS